MRALLSRIFLPFGLVTASILIFGCGGGSGNTAESSQTATNPGSNVQAITVNGGPDFNFVDGAFTSVTVCVPGSSTNCQTIGGILVDTGSSGLRILSSALTVSLPQQTNSTGSPIAECAVFADGIIWGPVQTADVKIAGEQASSLPICQVIGSPEFFEYPQKLHFSQGQPARRSGKSGQPTACLESGSPSRDLRRRPALQAAIWACTTRVHPLLLARRLQKAPRTTGSKPSGVFRGR